MPGILPMRVIKAGAGRDTVCVECRNHNIQCDCTRPSCDQCTSRGARCTYGPKASRLSQACDRCTSKKIRCDGVQPCCTQCENVGSECKTTEKLNRRPFPRGYTESLEDRVRSLETQNRDLNRLLNGNDDSLGPSNDVEFEHKEGLLPPQNPQHTAIRLTNASQAHEPTFDTFTIVSYELTKHTSGSVNIAQEPIASSDVSRWIESCTNSAEHSVIAPALKLLVIETPDEPKHGKILPSRNYRENLKACFGPTLDRLGIPPKILKTFGSVIFEKFSNSTPQITRAGLSSVEAHSYFIAFGFFSVAWRYFPASKRSIGLLFQQDEDSKNITSNLLKTLSTHCTLMRHPSFLPISSHKAISVELSCWMTRFKEEIFAAQGQTGYHHMLAIEAYQGNVDYSRLSSKISGIAINIATSHFCWQVLEDHIKFVIREAEQLLKLSESKTEAAGQNQFMACATQMEREARFMLQQTESWQKKASIQIQGLFNLIAQNDQMTSVSIARDSRTLAQESKKDSSSMKTIAVVTMVFLPGTFVASLFSMPIFQWNAEEGASVVNSRFWIYWIVALPLTLSTIMCWWSWNKHRVGSRYKGDEEKANTREDRGAKTVASDSS